MDPIFFIFQDAQFVTLLPTSIEGWLGWLVLIGVVIWLAYRWRNYQVKFEASHWVTFALLLVFSIILNLLKLGFRFPAGAALSPPNMPANPPEFAMLALSSLPWMLAGGMLGPAPAAIIAFAGGLVRFPWDSQSIFSPTEMALLGILFSAAARQRYRTVPYRLLREPMIAIIGLSILYAIIFLIDSFLLVPGELTSRVDFALTRVFYSTAAVAIQMAIASLFAQVLALVFPGQWGRRLPLLPSPTERSLETRFLFGTGTLIISLLLALLVGDWIVAGAAARQMLQSRMQASAQLAAQSVPFFLETGQNLAGQIASNPALLTSSGDSLNTTLGEQMRSVPYFDQLIIFEPGAPEERDRVVAYYPDSPEATRILFPEEKAGLDLAFNGVISQTYPIPPLQQDQPARVSFIFTITDPATGKIPRVLVGRTSLGTNPFTQPLLNSLNTINELGGQGILLDENGRILYHPIATLVMAEYSGQLADEPKFLDDIATDGTRNMVYVQPSMGRAWRVVLTVPAQRAQQLALNVAAPMTLMIFLLAVVALVSLRLGLKAITNSMQTLASEAVRIAQGQLDHPLPVEGVDEVGQLRRAFEQMRASLQARLEELNRLLLVSQGVASSLEMGDAVEPVMEAILATGASTVRVVTSLSVAQDVERDAPSIFALGPAKGQYAYLDEQVVQLTRQQERVILTNVNRARGLDLRPGAAPASLIAFPLRHENRYYGVLWAAYDHQRLFSETDVRFLTTLAGQAALAASNNHLFLSAEVGRQRLAAILASTPDPVLVTDHLNRLLLANPAAWQTLGPAVGTGEGQPIERVVSQQPLLDVLQATSPDKLSAEVTLPSGQVFLATASPVLADGRSVGRVCILRDVTHFKELDTMKTEFVNTVSHDLRSPLTLMRGYATMLEMVGELNEQQHGYVKKMITGVENMSRLVNNLLDLGRIEVGVGLQLEMVPLLDIVERVTSTLQMQASQKEIELSVTLPQNTVPLIQADQALFQQAIYNLVENAIKYTPQGGTVSVRVSIVDDAMLFEVQDTGIGIAPIDQPRLFEKFYRGGQREAREQKGSGLGLAIVKSIAERHGGKVWLESQLGKGSTFFLQVPLRQTK